MADELAFASPVAKMYRVDAIPASFLVSTAGVTVGLNLRGNGLQLRLEELFKEEAAKAAAAEAEPAEASSENLVDEAMDMVNP